MNTSNAAQQSINAINGVNVDEVMALIGAIGQDTSRATLEFRVANRWIDGGLNRSRIQGFSAGGHEDETRTTPFELDNDEPQFLASDDTAPNPVEYLLHALAGCLTTTMVYHAAVQGIRIESVDSSLAGDLDLRGIFGLSDEVRKGYRQIEVILRVKTEASAAELRELAQFSPVYEMVSRAVPVDLRIDVI